MPIYEFKCKKCGNTFEKLIFSSDEEAKLACPLCGERDTCKLMSSFSSGSSSICPTSSGGFS
jgi:putative FmdB family regulatory protein